MKYYLAIAVTVHLGGGALLLGYGWGEPTPQRGDLPRTLWVSLPPRTAPNLGPSVPPERPSVPPLRPSAPELEESPSSVQPSAPELEEGPTSARSPNLAPSIPETLALLPASFQWEYPEAARRGRGQEGRAVLKVEVADTGQVASIAILESSGHPLLDSSAADQLRRIRLVPATLDGLPVASTVRFAVEFRLR